MPPDAKKQSNSAQIELTLQPVDNARLANLSGQFDEHLSYIEKYAEVEIHHRGHQFRLLGSDAAIGQAARVIESLYAVAAEKQISKEDVHLVLREQPVEKDQLATAAPNKDDDVVARRNKDNIIINTHYGKIKGRGENQCRYLENIFRHDINFGVGPAGTGKTYLAVACAVEALEREAARRIILVRPAVEAGERLGFLPGDLSQKVDPYLRPLYDALYEMMGVEKVERFIERNVIEIAPLAYMRGRTLNDSFIILDEAQNTTVEQMKMFLTRIGFGSTAVITGDVTQIDLPRDQSSGLKQVIEVLRDVKGISFTFFESRDVVRHPLVQKIVDAYDRFHNAG